jgi:hypothetical protein
MLAFLDGSASTFEIERVRSYTPFELVFASSEWVFPLFRYGVRGDSFWGRPEKELRAKCALCTKRFKQACNVPRLGGNSWLASEN